MPKKCEHLEECDDCAKQIPAPLPDAVSRIQQILLTMERKRQELKTAISNENRYKISVDIALRENRRSVEAAEHSLEQTKIQLGAELRKIEAADVVAATKEVANA